MKNTGTLQTFTPILAPVDILLNSQEEIRQKQELRGHIICSIVREGLAL